ncbi:MAG TPA: hypothetical protein VHU81_13700 [Thermoanaerobaculia bacterium]|jgi:hypothetical protein|nr:hypothetical protein [Thermoanaerobaculia bacterium]
MRQRHFAFALVLAVFALALLPALRPALADPPVPPEAWVTCKPVESLVWLGGRFHVKCEQGWSNPSTGNSYPYFAISGSNTAQLEQAMSMVQTAQISGKRVKLRIKTSSTANPSGCQTDDCRAFIAIGVVN